MNASSDRPRPARVHKVALPRYESPGRACDMDAAKVRVAIKVTRTALDRVNRQLRPIWAVKDVIHRDRAALIRRALEVSREAGDAEAGALREERLQGMRHQWQQCAGAYGDLPEFLRLIAAHLLEAKAAAEPGPDGKEQVA